MSTAAHSLDAQQPLRSALKSEEDLDRDHPVGGTLKGTMPTFLFLYALLLVLSQVTYHLALYLHEHLGDTTNLERSIQNDVIGLRNIAKPQI